MAAAGPAGNLAIAFVAFVLIKIGLASGWFIAARQRQLRAAS